MVDKTPFGALIVQEQTAESLSCFREKNLDKEWTFLTSKDENHSLWTNSSERAILEFDCGTVTKITAPDDFMFALEVQVQLQFQTQGYAS